MDIDIDSGQTVDHRFRPNCQPAAGMDIDIESGQTVDLQLVLL